jgi:hypothetical protein
MKSEPVKKLNLNRETVRQLGRLRIQSTVKAGNLDTAKTGCCKHSTTSDSASASLNSRTIVSEI